MFGDDKWLRSAGTCFLRVCLPYGAFIWQSNRDRAVVGVTKTTLKPTLVPSCHHRRDFTAGAKAYIAGVGVAPAVHGQIRPL